MSGEKVAEKKDEESGATDRIPASQDGTNG